jgi:dGTPase
VHELIDVQVSDVLQQAGGQLSGRRFANPQAARASNFRVGPSAAMRRRKEELEQFLYANVYRHPRLLVMRKQAQHRLETLFDILVGDLDLLPGRFRHRVPRLGPVRAVADYLAGMTDRYCEHKFQELTAGRAVG